ncbi:hypothetical protein Y032_0035g3057 [Ancylostoma ceylanicum]|uniref:Uncharacterized protein n=1 Tax=Ancylostoma ceylanicum TaxID=53326 RepID=A0A016UN73_9BILA|nr:hypothetical protein Y032_0035g3057 [Ancylostoma ceylanicum]
MAATHPRPQQGRRATAPHTPESLSAAGVLFLGAFLPNLVILSLFPCFITRSSVIAAAANDIDSGARGAVARRVCQDREWVVTIDAHCTGNGKVNVSHLILEFDRAPRHMLPQFLPLQFQTSLF